MFLCPGIPGAGKTIMSSMVVDTLDKQFADNGDVAITFVYCSYQTQQEQRPEDILASILRQLIQRQADVPRHIDNLYETCKTKNITRLTMDDIMANLGLTIRLYSKVYIVVDALDEYHATNHENTKELLSRVFTLVNLQPVNLFTTTRHVPEITSLFDGYAVVKEIRAQDDDLYQYVDAMIPKLLRGTISRNESDLRDTVREQVVKAADGM